MSDGGLLIINGDDWGASQSTTDAMRRCTQAGAVTSLSGMVFMADSERAAQIARADDLAVGLHLNLTEPFDAAIVNDAVRARQERVARRMARARYPGWLCSRDWITELHRCIGDQFVEFERLYGGPPAHLDGHLHVHQLPAVLAGGVVRPGMRLRPMLTFMPGEKSVANRFVRAAANSMERVRFRTPRYFFSIRDMHPRLGGRGLEEKLALSSGSAVEVMTHPSWEDEQAVLLDPAWRELIENRPLGSYRDL